LERDFVLREEVREGWRKLLNEELSNLQFLTNIVRMITLRK
jgi:hypothetical protein